MRPWLLNHETEVRGAWVRDAGTAAPDDNCRRIWALIQEQLVEVARVPGSCDVLYVDPGDGRYWELLHPATPGRLGEPPVLRHVSRDDARARYPATPSASARPAPGLSKGLLVFAAVAVKFGVVAAVIAFAIGQVWWKGWRDNRVEVRDNAIVAGSLGLRLPLGQGWAADERTEKHEVTLRRTEPAATFQLLALDAGDGAVPDAGVEPGRWNVKFDGAVRNAFNADDLLGDREIRRVTFDLATAGETYRYRAQTVPVGGSVLVLLCSAPAWQFTLAEAACDELLRGLELRTVGK